MVKVLLLGQSGQLASELRSCKPDAVELKVLSYVEFCAHAEIELKQLFFSFSPDWVINAVAYNRVDHAELFPELAMAGNFYLLQKLQRLCVLTQSKLLHISTDYVFDGLAKSPYKEEDQVQPINQYGKSKSAAELWLLQEYADASVIIRTSWLYSGYGSNFVKTMLRLMQNQTPLNVVQDQIGSPCWAYGLAEVIWQLIIEQKIKQGLYHWADTGFCSRYEFALEIRSLALELGLLCHKTDIVAVSSDVFSNTAVRPAFSALDSTVLRERLCLPECAWQQNLARALTLFLPAQTEKKD